MNLTSRHLKTIFPSLSAAKADVYAPFLRAAMVEGRITTRPRAVAFLAELGHESNELKNLREIWGPTPAQRRYDVRTDLGNTPERDGDGEKYKGRGGLQRTGRDNYLRAQEELGLPLVDHPELLEKPEHAFRSDTLFWNDKKLNQLADKLTLKADGKDLAQFDRITKIINGGYNGRVDRQVRYLEIRDALPDELFDLVPPVVPPAAAPIVPDVPTSAPEAEGDDFLQKISANETAQQIGRTAAQKTANRLGTPIGIFLSALLAGNKWAWLVVIGAAVFIYFERRAIARNARRLYQKVRSIL